MSLTIDLHLDSWKIKPYAHQLAGVKLLLEHKFFGLFDEMGCGKSAQVINAACELSAAGEIDTVLVISPAAVRSVWSNAEWGEIKKHSWAANRVTEFHNPTRLIWKDDRPKLDWLISNYEFVRNSEHQDRLLKFLENKRTLMIADEAAFIKSRTAAQTKACVKIGQKMQRRVILNGTPVGNNPLDLWSQMFFLSPTILPFKNFFQFRADFCVLGGWHNKQVVQWVHLDKLQNLVAPHVIRREKKDCLDLPEKIVAPPREVPLSESSWRLYKQMRDEAVVWLDENPSLAAQAGVRVMRLSQITSGFLGGFNPEGEEAAGLEAIAQVIELGREKLEALRAWVSELLADNPYRKIIVWCRFRKELERVHQDLKDLLPTYKLYGGQSRKEREEAIGCFSKTVGDRSPALLAGQVQAGGFGLNLVGADAVAYLSNDFNLLTRLQSEDRVHRPGQKSNVLYLDVLATGPKGQKTVDHAIVKALKGKSDLATWTCAAWKQALQEE